MEFQGHKGLRMGRSVTLMLIVVRVPNRIDRSSEETRTSKLGDDGLRRLLWLSKTIDAYGWFSSGHRVKTLELLRWHLLVLSWVVKFALVRHICRKRTNCQLSLRHRLDICQGNLFFGHRQVGIALKGLLPPKIRNSGTFCLAKIYVSLDTNDLLWVLDPIVRFTTKDTNYCFIRRHMLFLWKFKLPLRFLVLKHGIKAWPDCKSFLYRGRTWATLCLRVLGRRWLTLLVEYDLRGFFISACLLAPNADLTHDNLLAATFRRFWVSIFTWFAETHIFWNATMGRTGRILLIDSLPNRGVRFARLLWGQNLLLIGCGD